MKEDVVEDYVDEIMAWCEFKDTDGKFVNIRACDVSAVKEFDEGKTIVFTRNESFIVNEDYSKVVEKLCW